jgi:hypothetical protein
MATYGGAVCLDRDVFGWSENVKKEADEKSVDDDL